MATIPKHDLPCPKGQFHLAAQRRSQAQPPHRGLNVASALRRAAVEALEGRRLMSASVTGFTLVNAVADTDLVSLSDGAVIDLAALSTRSLNIRADVSGESESVRFGFDGVADYRIENSDPYALAGGTGLDYSDWTPTVGTHTLTATAFAGDDATGEAGTAATITFTVVDTPTPNGAPADLAATALSPTQLQLSWGDAGTSETHFVIDRSTDGVTWSRLTNVPAGSTGFTDGRAVPGTTYHYRVKAIGETASLNSDWSAVASGTTPAVAPGGVTATPTSSTSIQLTWTDNSANEALFVIDRSTDGTTWARLGKAKANATAVTDRTVSSGTKYYYRVMAVGTSAAASSAWSAAASATTPTPAGTSTAAPAPAGVVARAPAPDTVYVNWTDRSTNETHFIIDRSTDGRKFVRAGYAAANKTGFTDTAAQPGTKYFYRVKAITASARTNSDWSTVTSTTTSSGVGTAAPATPTGTTARAASAGVMYVNWADRSTNETAFVVERSTNGSTFSEVGTAAANKTGFTDSSVAPGTTYYYRVKAVSGPLGSGWSPVVSATTPVGFAISRFVLVNADTDEDIMTLSNGAILDLAALGTRNLNVRADVGGDAGSVLFEIDGTSRYENSAPYAMAGNGGDDYNAWTPEAGNHSLTATPFAESDGDGSAGGAMTVAFTVVDTPPVLTPPTAPSGVGAAALSATHVRVTWTDRSTNEQGFRIERTTDGVTWTFVANAAANATAHTNSGLSAETTYTYRVRAYNDAGPSAFAAPATVTTAAPDTTEPPANPGEFASWEEARTHFSANTGPTTPGSLQTVGGITTTHDGQVIEGVYITGGVTIKHKNVTIRNFKLKGMPTYGIFVDSGASGAVIEDGEIDGGNSCAIFAKAGVTIRRVEIHHTGADGIKLENFDGSVVEGNWWHHLGLNEGSHADGIQIRKGGNYTIRGNFSDMPVGVSGTHSNSAFIIGSALSEIDNVVIDGNWLNGGNYTVYVLDADMGDPTNVRITDNWFGRDFRYGTHQLDGDVAWSGNRWLDTEQLIPR